MFNVKAIRPLSIDILDITFLTVSVCSMLSSGRNFYFLYLLKYFNKLLVYATCEFLTVAVFFFFKFNVSYFRTKIGSNFSLPL